MRLKDPDYFLFLFLLMRTSVLIGIFFNHVGADKSEKEGRISLPIKLFPDSDTLHGYPSEVIVTGICIAAGSP